MSEITIYGFSASPFVRKAMVLCEEKDLAYRNAPVSPRDIPAELKPHSPLSKIPFAQIGGKWLADSSIICQYLESIHPTPALYPAEAYDRARALWIEEFIDGGLIARTGPKTFIQRVIHPLFLGQAPDEAMVQDAVDNDLPPLLDYLEQQIGTAEFYVGDQFTIADISVASALANLMHARIDLDAARWPNVVRHRDAVLGRRSFARLIEQEKHMLAALADKASAPASSYT